MTKAKLTKVQESIMEDMGGGAVITEDRQWGGGYEYQVVQPNGMVYPIRHTTFNALLLAGKIRPIVASRKVAHGQVWSQRYEATDDK